MSAPFRRPARAVPRAFARPAGWLALSAVALIAAGQAGTAEEKPSPDGLAFFEKKIRPVLAKNCYSCHSGSVQAKGGLRVDTRVGLLIGGTSGPAVVPGSLEKSKIVAALHYDGPDMPPADQLPAEIIADFEAWIKMGAPDPRGEENKYVAKKKIDYAAERKQWAYTAPTLPPVPAASDGWAWTDIDKFVRTKQQTTGTKPVADADPVTWLRRVSFDLVGLPPTPEQIVAIERDSRRAVREKIVDELLASPRFGERWGRHWLDVARYAESSGRERNFPYPQAWKYRDWVIDALNADKPYDQFLKEQVAGDLLPTDSLADRDANVIATGFLALGPKGLNERNRESYLLDIADEQIENATRTVLALSVGCARCHDHKFDPVSMVDYYALAGIFRSTETKAGVMTRNFSAGQPGFLVTLPSAGKPVEELADQKLLAEIRELEKEARDRGDDLRRSRELATAETLAALSANTPAFMTAPADTQRADEPIPELEAKKDGPPPALGSYEDIRGRQLVSFRLNRKLGSLRARYARETAHLTAAAVKDLPDPRDINIRIRGEADNVGPVVPRGYPQVVSVPSAPSVDPKESGRRQLAEWLTRPENPLTARVFVNRLWAKLYGAGIVPTLDDFGDQGQKPVNPELLDFLAVRFVQQGWSVKAALKELVLTRTYQLSGADDASDLAKDEANVSLWRWNRRRLDGEALRDATLVAGGKLDTGRPAGSSVIDLGFRELGPNSDYSPVEKPSQYRSVYLPILRGKVPEALAVFDMPDPSLVVGQRDATTSPGQALFLLNSPFVLEQAGQVARNVLTQTQLDDAARIDRVYLTVLGRRPTDAEREKAARYLAKSGANDPAAWTRFAQALLALPEFRYLF